MILGGRDIDGFPSVPVPAPNGDIFFLSTNPGSPREEGGPAITPSVLVASLTFEPGTCQPILSAGGTITCAFSECDDCLRVVTRDSWTTAVACVCR